MKWMASEARALFDAPCADMMAAVRRLALGNVPTNDDDELVRD